MDFVEVVLVSRKREDFLGVTLSCILNQDIDIPIRLYLIRHENNPYDTYLLKQLKQLLRYNMVDVLEYYMSESNSLAYCRSECIKQLKNNYFIMLDNDIWFPSDTFSKLIKGMAQLNTDTKQLAVTLPFIDVDNTRNYKDHNLKRYKNLKTFQVNSKSESEEQSKELCELAVQQDGRALQLVKDKFITKELCNIAVIQNGFALQYVKDEFITKELCELAVKQNGYTLRHVKDELQ